MDRSSQISSSETPESKQSPHIETRSSSKREQLTEHDVDTQIALEEQDCSEDSPVAIDTLRSQKQNVISFTHDDPDNPYHWPSTRKIGVVIVGIAMVMNSTIGSSVAAGASDEISRYFHISNQEQLVLPTSIYLIGYVVGPLLFGPLSESYGRKWVITGTFV